MLVRIWQLLLARLKGPREHVWRHLVDERQDRGSRSEPAATRAVEMTDLIDLPFSGPCSCSVPPVSS